jgi:hypothetical protein
MDQGHQRQESVVGDAENSHLPVGLRDVLDQPVDGVVCVGRLIDGSRVQGTVNRPVHHVVAFRAVFAADVLNDADVSVFDNHVGGVVVAVERGPQVRAGQIHGELVG